MWYSWVLQGKLLYCCTVGYCGVLGGTWEGNGWNCGLLGGTTGVLQGTVRFLWILTEGYCWVLWGYFWVLIESYWFLDFNRYLQSFRTKSFIRLIGRFKKYAKKMCDTPRLSSSIYSNKNILHECSP